MENEKLKERLLDLKERQLSGEHMLCPRCGRDQMKSVIHTNALSRHEDIYVCDACGNQESVLVFMRNPIPLSHWACFYPKRPDSGFMEMTGAEVWERIRNEHVPILVRIYERWLNHPDEADMLRLEAFENCSGLGELWCDTFRAAYEAKDGQVILRFKKNGKDIEVTCSLISR